MSETERPEKSILVIDDEPSVADALRMILTDNGYEVVIAGDGEAGIDETNRRDFDLAITDYCLPGISGLEVLIRLKNGNSEIPVIVISAHTTPEKRAELMGVGAFEVLPKPFLPTDILVLIELALKRKHLLAG